jgi:hypothetical protein
MSVDDPDPLIDRLIGHLAAYDEALARGNPDPAADAPWESPAVLERWHRLKSALHLLRDNPSVWSPVADEVIPSPLDRAFYPGESSGRFGRFLIRRELGRGGFGIVFLAEDPRLHRLVALKVPRPDALVNADLRQRFLREAQAAANLDHPNVVPVFEAGEIGSICYLVSAYCSGDDLAVWLSQQVQPPPPRCAAALVASLAEAVEHAHRRGIFHRDIKPSNILLVPRSESATAPSDDFGFEPKLTDFGLAKLLETGCEETTSGVLLGTPAYMAPEQAEGWGQAVGAATDIYLLGLILYELLTLRRPFAEASLLLTLEQVRLAQPILPQHRRAEIPRDLEVICLKCLCKDPAGRYAAAAALARDLNHFLRQEPIEARMPGLLSKGWDWCRRAERIRDAAVIGTLQGSLAVLVSATGIFLLLTGIFPVERLAPALYQLVPFNLAGCLMIWISRLTLARHRLALWAGVCLPLLMPAYILATLAGLVDSGGFIPSNEPRFMILAQTFTVVFLSTITIIAYALALIAYHANRHRPGFAPESQR